MSKILNFLAISVATLVLLSNGIRAENPPGSPGSNDAYADKESIQFNYAEALQKCLYFLEAQQNGKLSPNNRVGWRGDANLTDGQDIHHDLAGGLFDAGDHWTANITMAFLTTTLAWSAVEKPEGWIMTGQIDELLETLIHMNNYFIKCVLNPEVNDPATKLEIAIGCGGREGVPDPPVHAIWAGAEMASATDPATGKPFTNRPTFRLNSSAPGGDVPAAMASAMAASSMVIRAHGDLLAKKSGYADFNASAYADQLYNLAGKLTTFAQANMGPVIADDLPAEKKEAIIKTRNSALRSDGEIVETGYRSGPVGQIFSALTWMARASEDSAQGQSWIDRAEEFYEGPYKAENYTGFWHDYGWGDMGKLGAYNMVRLLPDAEQYHFELQDYCVSFLKYNPTPGGLRIREKWAHEYGSLRHANNAAAIVLYYSDLVDSAPVLSGNTWWKGSLTNDELKSLFVRTAKRQVDYALGANPYGRSYLVGFGKDPFNNPHHRGAFGPWDGYDHFIEGKDSRRTTSRHILYGALLAGPDIRDVFLTGDKTHTWQKVPGSTEEDTYYLFSNRKGEAVRKTGYTFDPKDLPAQDVMDSKFNEVALDYNAGFMASLAWLNAAGLSDGSALPDSEFPPKEVRDESLDPRNTDREFFVTGKLVEDSGLDSKIEARIWNRSRWPARELQSPVVRFYFSHPGVVSASLSDAPGAVLSEIKTDDAGKTFFEISWPGVTLAPVNSASNSRAFTLRLEADAWDSKDDWWRTNASDNAVAVLPNVPVFQSEKTIGGTAPR